MSSLNNEDGTLNGVTVYYDVDGNKFVIDLDSIEVTLTEEAVSNILQAIINSPEYRVVV